MDEMTLWVKVLAPILMTWVSYPVPTQWKERTYTVTLPPTKTCIASHTHAHTHKCNFKIIYIQSFNFRRERSLILASFYASSSLFIPNKFIFLIITINILNSSKLQWCVDNFSNLTYKEPKLPINYVLYFLL